MHICRSRALQHYTIPDAPSLFPFLPPLLTPTPWSHYFSRSHLSQLPRQRCCADSYRDQQMEAVMARATVIPQFNSVLGFFSPTPICLKLRCQDRCPQFAEHSAKKVARASPASLGSQALGMFSTHTFSAILTEKLRDWNSIISPEPP